MVLSSMALWRKIVYPVDARADAKGGSCEPAAGAGTPIPRRLELCSKVVYRQITTDLNKVAYCCYKGFPTK